MRNKDKKLILAVMDNWGKDDLPMRRYQVPLSVINKKRKNNPMDQMNKPNGMLFGLPF